MTAVAAVIIKAIVRIRYTFIVSSKNHAEVRLDDVIVGIPIAIGKEPNHRELVLQEI
jgi:hypothetical protein